jgi:hypothetical protein
MIVDEAAHQMALGPLLWLAALRARGTVVGTAWWWLAGAFFVSWLADTGAHVVDPWLMSLVYPVSQAAIVGAVLLEREDAVLFVLALALVGILAVLWRGVGTPDVLVHTVAWGSIACVAFDRDALGNLRLALIIAFGFGLVAWLGYTITPGYQTWLCYQGVRALGIGTFCWAAAKPGPTFRVLA